MSLNLSGEQLFAVKMITHCGQVATSDLSEEIQALRYLKHPNIVGYEEMIRLPLCTYICMEYCSGGDLRDMMDTAIDTKWVFQLHWGLESCIEPYLFIVKN